MKKLTKVISVISGTFLIYCVIPNIYARNYSKNVIRKINPENKQIALTFDDGPNEKYTNRVLDILKKYNIKATFFIVIKNANKNLDIIKRIKAEGHQIAFHSYKHQSAWEILPHQTLTEFKRGEQDLNIANIKFEYHRPPWGTFNLFTLYAILKNNMKAILWSVEAYDWRANSTGVKIANIIMKRVSAGDIIVLHDSGGAKNAPENTIKALDIFIPKLIKQGYNFKTITEGLVYNDKKNS